MDKFNLKEYLKHNPLLKEETLVDTLMDKVKGMSSNEFKALASKAGDLEIWKSGGDIDGINNVDDRLETISQGFNNDDAKRYLDIIKENISMEDGEDKITYYAKELIKMHTPGDEDGVEGLLTYLADNPEEMPEDWDVDFIQDPNNYNDIMDKIFALTPMQENVDDFIGTNIDANALLKILSEYLPFNHIYQDEKLSREEAIDMVDQFVEFTGMDSTGVDFLNHIAHTEEKYISDK